jgi:hypothetical protein
MLKQACPEEILNQACPGEMLNQVHDSYRLRNNLNLLETDRLFPNPKGLRHWVLFFL